MRIRLSVAAYAYEFENTSILSDAEFDKLCLEVDTLIPTGNKRMDLFFKRRFDPSTGQWVHSHPEKHKLKQIYERFHK